MQVIAGRWKNNKYKSPRLQRDATGILSPAQIVRSYEPGILRFERCSTDGVPSGGDACFGMPDGLAGNGQRDIV